MEHSWDSESNDENEAKSYPRHEEVAKITILVEGTTEEKKDDANEKDDKSGSYSDVGDKNPQKVKVTNHVQWLESAEEKENKGCPTL